MDLNENIIIELVGANETDKETLIDYFEKKGIANLFVEYDVLDISEITKMQISNILTILESNSGEK
ncbi:hypothetical protein ACF3M2_14060 [Tissierella carlieri]|uniref:hypothetical protein n=1 Tax=Tissierella carlieri TaxID=689904 RepID=UPI00386AC992